MGNWSNIYIEREREKERESDLMKARMLLPPKGAPSAFVLKRGRSYIYIYSFDAG